VARTVVFLHPSASLYGADLQLYGLATGLDPARYRPLVVLPEDGPLATRLEAAGVETHRAPVAVLRRRLARGRGGLVTAEQLWRGRREVGRLARARGAAVVHTNTSVVLGGHPVANAAGAAHVVHVREIYSGAGGRLTDALWPFLRRHLLHADALPCASAAAAGQFDGSTRTLVIHDGIVRTPKLVSRAAARAALGLPADRFVVSVVGRLSDWKGQDVLACALVEPALARIGAIGLLAGAAAPGQDHHRQALLDLRQALGLDERLRLLGFQEDVGTVLAAADVVAVPSTHPEALPNSALEAAAAGRCVVATACGGTPEILRHDETGKLVPPGDVRALAATLADLAGDPALVTRLGEAAASDVSERFDLRRTADAVQECYDRVIRPRARPSAWLLPGEPMPVTAPAAPQLRRGRIEEWLGELGYRPKAVGCRDQTHRGSAGRGTARAARQALRSFLSTPVWTLAALRDRPRVVYTNTALNAPALAAIKSLLGSRVTTVADLMGLRWLETAQTTRLAAARSVHRPLWLALERLLVARADVVLTINGRCARQLEQRHGRSDVRVLRDAAEPELTAIAAADRETLGLPVDALAVGFVGSLVCSRLDPLFDAWSRLSPNGNGSRARPTPCLVVIGDGPDLPAYRRRAAAAGWLDRTVFLLGALPREEALGVLRACDIAYSDCWSQAGFPLKVYEYMAVGVPILVQGRPQASEVLTDGHDALFHGPDDLGRRLCELAEQPELRTRLATAARATFVAGHTLSRRRREFTRMLHPVRT
jgi:glycosyltransferase involved in cell wall biosynthesis